jgi:hypothetical protein
MHKHVYTGIYVPMYVYVCRMHLRQGSRPLTRVRAMPCWSEQTEFPEIHHGISSGLPDYSWSNALHLPTTTTPAVISRSSRSK